MNDCKPLLLGVSTTCGNQSVEKTTDNALRAGAYTRS